LFLVAEVLGAGGFLLGTGAAALFVAAISYAFGLSWQLQLLCFAILSILLSYVYIRHMRPNAPKSEDPLLNNKMARLVGRQAKLTKAVENGIGRVQIQDAFWTVKSEVDLPAESSVTITGYEGSTLIVETTNSDQQ